MIRRISELLRHETAGDPMKGLKWIRRATRKISRELKRLEIRISATTVRRLLKRMGFSLRVNHKRLESDNKNLPPRRIRNQQFLYIGHRCEEFFSRGKPVISVDSKKKELIGNFKNPGVAWQREPYWVKDHDFRSDAEGMAIPYGIYDTQRNYGFVVVGTSTETPSFPVDAIVSWWESRGNSMYPDAKEILILADCAGVTVSARAP